jgi:hypothetical protein
VGVGLFLAAGAWENAIHVCSFAQPLQDHKAYFFVCLLVYCAVLQVLLARCHQPCWSAILSLTRLAHTFVIFLQQSQDVQPTTMFGWPVPARLSLFMRVKLVVCHLHLSGGDDYALPLAQSMEHEDPAVGLRKGGQKTKKAHPVTFS